MDSTHMTEQADRTARRREWLAVLAHAPREALQGHAQAISGDGFEWLRRPEVGLAMLRGRVGNQGDRFNLGEATMTRCVLRHRGAMGTLRAGIGYVLGRDEERAEWIARLDALLQQPEHHEAVQREVIAPLRAALAARHAQEASQTAASRVRFFTLQPEKT